MEAKFNFNKFFWSYCRIASISEPRETKSGIKYFEIYSDNDHVINEIKIHLSRFKNIEVSRGGYYKYQLYVIF